MADVVSKASRPVVEGPIPGAPQPLGGAPEFDVAFDLAVVGYGQEEFFVSGVATSYTVATEWSDDGRWSAAPAMSAPYTTRVVVRRPLDAGRFNGTVVVEWLNVSGGLDAAPDWSNLHRHLVRDGFVWVGVSAQKAGIEGGGLFQIDYAPFLKRADPQRYEPLEHPGDAFAYDIFTQIGRVLRQRGHGSLLGSLEAQRLLAVGESQSALFLVTYVNGIDHLVTIYDGYLLHGRGPSGAPLAGLEAVASSASPELEASVRDDLFGQPPEQIRDDIRVPVITLQSETDVFGLRGIRARQPDNERFRLWEIAGAAHADTYLLLASAHDSGSLTADELAALLNPVATAPGGTSDSPINSGPQQHYVGQAALAHLDRWVRGGSPPPMAPRLETATDESTPAFDEHGIAAGGIRTPWVEVPTAVLSGVGQHGSEFAFLFGVTTPFDVTTLSRLYPGGREDYLDKFDSAVTSAVQAGFLLEADASEIRALAAAGWSRDVGASQV